MTREKNFICRSVYRKIFYGKLLVRFIIWRERAIPTLLARRLLSLNDFFFPVLQIVFIIMRNHCTCLQLEVVKTRLFRVCLHPIAPGQNMLSFTLQIDLIGLMCLLVYKYALTFFDDCHWKLFAFPLSKTNPYSKLNELVETFSPQSYNPQQIFVTLAPHFHLNLSMNSSAREKKINHPSVKQTQIITVFERNHSTLKRISNWNTEIPNFSGVIGWNTTNFHAASTNFISPWHWLYIV